MFLISLLPIVIVCIQNSWYLRLYCIGTRYFLKYSLFGLPHEKRFSGIWYIGKNINPISMLFRCIWSFSQITANTSSGRQRGQISANRSARSHGHVSLGGSSGPELRGIFGPIRRTFSEH